MHSSLTPSGTTSLGAQKLAQAQALLGPNGLDAWLLVVRESADRPDPGLRLLLAQDFTWNTYFLVTPSRSIALVAEFDAPDLRAAGLFDEVRPYREGPKAALHAILYEADPRRIGINVSQHDALSDGLTAGLRDALLETLQGTPFASRLASAETLLAHLRGVKLPEEQRLIRRAVEESEEIFAEVGRSLRVGMTARDVADRFHAAVDRAGVRTAWPRGHCPSVTIGPNAPVGHVSPGTERITHGCIVHTDFGIARDGYCADLQRLWYVLERGEAEPPEEVVRAYDAIVSGIEIGARALRPGAVGWQVDQGVRLHLTAMGYPEYGHALGHHLGRHVHDGGGVLGPRWERYGEEPFFRVEEGNVFAIEPSVQLAGHGVVSLEEDVVVTARGAEFLSRFPRRIPVLRLD